MTSTATAFDASQTSRDHPLVAMFEPRSVAIIGASDRSTWSTYVHAALRSMDYPGQAYFVNPRGGTAHGERLYPDLASLPETPDQVFVIIPAAAVVATVADAAARGVRAAVVLTSGFAEVGGDGKAAQDALQDVAEKTGIRILGPNNLGFANLHARIGLTPTAGGPPLRPGPIAVVSQSGNLAGQVQTMAREFDAGLSLICSTGNEVDVTAGDVIDYLAEEPHTKAIAVFLETIRRPADFLAACRRARQAGKLVAVLKAGRSEAAARSAMAHTGSLVGDDAVIDAALVAAGAVRVDSLEELLVVVDVFSSIGPVHGPRLGVVSISGGASDIAADIAQEHGLDLPAITPQTRDALAAVLPYYATPQNPLDVTGAAIGAPAMFGECAAAMAADPGLDVLVVITEAEHSPSGWGEPMLAGLGQAVTGARLPALMVSTTMHGVSEETRAARALMAYPAAAYGIDRTLAAIAKIVRWTASPADAPADAPTPELTVTGSRTGTWSEWRSRAVLTEAGVPTVPSCLVRLGESVEVIPFDGPYAVKIVSDDIAHKSNIGGVKLDVDRSSLAATVATMVATVREKAPEARLDGVLVSPMRRGGVELLVGVVRDADWGCTMAIATGGVLTEILDDVSRLALPTTPAAIGAALDRLKGAPLLAGYRGSRPADRAALIRTITTLADTALALGPELAALEVNPLRVDGDTVEALDALIVWNS